ncbi:Hypothetical protein H16_A0017 [Cupriavidus necator H16]|uniref:Wadjet protein JetD C-terminal domain-containing protein n=1 Tax=Cupriavidus necator (strain ATCC 17699 / DSM 428 / KCTC 22496 / NCIMB 10442 / H16 / Stanier 337) TaxID=381666 RepID=Q0KFQ2_CUPNH|nr:Hypothetical protein H16_A0017 [Cupriavidus necator H16]
MQLKQLYFELYPEIQNHPERSRMLLQALQALAATGAIMLPARASWEKVGQPALPMWIKLVRTHNEAPKEDFSKIPWVPELGFWPELTSAQLAAAKCINEFLLQRRGNLQRIPIKERSLEIFGDEKRLDAMRQGNTLFSGRLSLDTLGAFTVPLPLPYRPAPVSGKPLLVVENHNSYWSFGEWNQRALRYSAVVYGAGEAFRSTGAALRQVLHEVKGTDVLYLGDLDPKGIGIPLDFNRSSASDEPKVAPAMEWYEWLLSHGFRRKKAVCTNAHPQSAIDWLGETLGEELAELWRGECWIPQEALGFEQLSAL